MFLVNSRLGLVSAAPSGFGRKSYTLPGRPFSRSYGANLPSSLTRVLSLALVFSTCPPVSVWGTGACALTRGFSWRLGRSAASPESARHRASGITRSGFAWTSPYTLTPGQPTPGSAYPSASPHCSPTTSGVGRPRRAFLSTLGLAGSHARRYGNINPFSIDYAFRPHLRSRLTLGGRTFPRNPWTFGGGDSHSSFATHAGIRTRAASTAGSRRRFEGCSTLPYRSCRLDPHPLGYRSSS